MFKSVIMKFEIEKSFQLFIPQLTSAYLKANRSFVPSPIIRTLFLLIFYKYSMN